jgi:hypothetical protein
MIIVKITMYRINGPGTKEIVAINGYKMSKEVAFGRNKAIMLLGDNCEIRDFYVDTCICDFINV